MMDRTLKDQMELVVKDWLVSCSGRVCFPFIYCSPHTCNGLYPKYNTCILLFQDWFSPINLILGLLRVTLVEPIVGVSR